MSTVICPNCGQPKLGKCPCAPQTCLDCTVLPPFSIVLCPLHAAAGDLLDVAQMLLDAGEGCGQGDCLHIVCCAARAAKDAVARATGKAG